MQPLPTPEETYKQQVSLHSDLLKALKRKRSNIGWLRLIMVVGILLLIYSLFFKASIIVLVLIAAGIAGFLYVISVDADNGNKIAEAERILAINNDELSIIAADYYNREDGLSYLPHEHPYAGDIDLFGAASLYQYINRCTSEQSKKLLSKVLLEASEKEVITARQAAAKSLAPYFEWRQKLQSAGMANPLTLNTEKKVKSWVSMQKPLQHSFWKVLPLIFTVITITTLGAYLLDWITASAFWLLIFVYFIIAKYTSSKVIETYLALSKIEGEIKTIEQQLQLVEELPASSSLLHSYKDLLVTKGNGTEGIKELKEILRRFDFRLNLIVFMILNTFFLWDVRQANRLNNWKDKYSLSVRDWFDILSNIELINTIATLTVNHPDWVFPSITDDHFTLLGEQIGHPLIDETKRVTSSFTTSGTGKVAIITGSNMAGKSTFLRSVAVNLVLAQMGAPVCATAFTFSIVKLYSSMRIADNLAENTSTFYAELKKLKSIIDQVKRHEKIFVLLDEILRGTNSLDRHTGSEALVKQLIKEQAVAVIATHDVELANLQEEYASAISNYHFDVQVEGEELYFDYKLKRGICQSMNASLLMKKIGIEM
ncbi:MAG: MutS-related protein [Segetibacter sp.]